MQTLDKQFHEDHKGSGFVFLEEEDCTLYGDGAVMTGRGIESVMRVPPANAFERARAVRDFRTVSLRIATKRFTNLADQVQAALSAADKSGDPPPDSSVVIPKLRELRRAVDTARSGLEKAEAECLALEPPMAKRQRENREKNRIARKAFSRELRKALKE